MSEFTEKKALAYIAAGKVKVIEHTDKTASIAVHGSAPEPYIARFSNGVWLCTCPAYKKECTHLIAARLISPLRTQVSGFNKVTDKEIEELLAGGPTHKTDALAAVFFMDEH